MALKMPNCSCMKTFLCIFIGITFILTSVIFQFIHKTGTAVTFSLRFASPKLEEYTTGNEYQNIKKYEDLDGSNRSSENKQIFKRKNEDKHYSNRELKQGDNLQREGIQKYAQVINKRIQVVKDKCAELIKLPFWEKLRGKHTGFVYSIPNMLNYCDSPKVGSTFWKSVLRFLTGDYPKKWSVKNPSDIDRTYVHSGKWRNIKRFKYRSNALKSEAMAKGKNLMFVREPYSRLWSGYVDKLYLPDFWKFAGPHFRLDIEAECINNITFEEFLTHIVEHSETLNSHWAPLYRLCSPCHVSYDVIGKMETFSNDSKFILKDFGHDLLEDTNPKSRAKEEILMLIKYNFNFKNGTCFRHELIAKRLWSAFQMNGYIHKTLSFPVEMFDTEMFRSRKGGAILVFMRYSLKAFKKQENLGLDPKVQRRQYMLDNYKTVPLPLLNKVKQLYKYDFELFGYDSEPIGIFSR